MTRNDCGNCTVTSGDKLDEFKNLFPDQGFSKVIKTFVRLNSPKGVTIDNLNNRLSLLNSELESKLSFKFSDYDGVLVLFGKLGKVLPGESQEALAHRCYLQIEGSIGGFSTLIFSGNNMLSGGPIICPRGVTLYDEAGWHTIVHEILHRFGAVDVYDLPLGHEGFKSYKQEALAVDPKTDESVMGNNDRTCIAAQTCTMQELDRLYIDVYNQRLLDAYITSHY